MRDDRRRLLHSRERRRSSWLGDLRDGAGYSSGNGAIAHSLGVRGLRRGGRRGGCVGHGYSAEGDGDGDGGQALAGAGALGLLADGVGPSGASDGLDGDGEGRGLRGADRGCGLGAGGGAEAGVVVRVNDVGLRNGVSMTTLATRVEGGGKRATRKGNVRQTQWQSGCA